ncbi:MAG: hypothetical protein ACUVTX_09925, partial [Bacteroidales bacterium]
HIMKKVYSIALFIIMVAYSGNAQNQKPKYEPVGKWQFEAPYAPEGYNTGIMEFIKAEGQYQAFISFTGSDYKIPLENVIVRNDSLLVRLYVEGSDVPIKLKMIEESKITGVALSPDGDIPLIATKIKQ